MNIREDETHEETVSPVSPTSPVSSRLTSTRILQPSVGEDDVVSKAECLRGGIMPFSKSTDGKMWILVGEKRNTNGTPRLTDFGGFPEEGETAMQTAIREMKEEFGCLPLGTFTTHHITGGIKADDTVNTIAKFVKFQCIFMMEVTDERELKKRFVTNGEVASVRWIHIDEFRKMTDEALKFQRRTLSRSLRILRGLFVHLTDNEVFYGNKDGNEWTKV